MAAYAKGVLTKHSMLVVLLATILIFEVLLANAGRTFLLGNPAHVNNLIAQNGYVIILAIGMLMCIITGGNIDLSVGSIVVLVGAIGALLMSNLGLPPWMVIILCMVAGVVIGSWQAFWIAYMGIPPFIVTLAGMLTFRGLALIFMDGRNIAVPLEFRDIFQNFLPVSIFPNMPREYIFYTSMAVGIALAILIIALRIASYFNRKRKGYKVGNFALELVYPIIISAGIVFVFFQLGQHNGIPAVLILIAIVFLIYSYFTQNTVWGRYLYAMGGNAKAARLSGINTKKMMFFAYANNGFLASIAAMVVMARFAAANTSAGVGFELDAIAACFIGGASAYGGVGKVGGVVIGAIFMGVLNMGMSNLGVNQNLQSVISGSVLLAAVIFDVISKKRKGTV